MLTCYDKQRWRPGYRAIPRPTAEFEDLAYLLIWDHWPSTAEKEAFRKELATAAQIVPDSVTKVIQSFP